MVLSITNVSRVLLLCSLSSGASAWNVGSPLRRQTAQSKSAARPQAVAIPLDIPPSTTNDVLSSTPQEPPASNLAPEDEWVAKLDYDAFGKEVTALGKELLADTGDNDVEHLQKIVGWRNAAAVVGLASVWMAPNPITIVALSLWTYASWTMIAHHTCHGGYNRVDAGRFNSRGFALGLVNR